MAKEKLSSVLKRRMDEIVAAALEHKPAMVFPWFMVILDGNGTCSVTRWDDLEHVEEVVKRRSTVEGSYPVNIMVLDAAGKMLWSRITEGQNLIGVMRLEDFASYDVVTGGEPMSNPGELPVCFGKILRDLSNRSHVSSVLVVSTPQSQSTVS